MTDVFYSSGSVLHMAGSLHRREICRLLLFGWGTIFSMPQISPDTSDQNYFYHTFREGYDVSIMVHDSKQFLPVTPNLILSRNIENEDIPNSRYATKVQFRILRSK